MLTVVIIAKNEEKNLPDTIKSIKAQTFKKKFEVLLSDGKSKDRTRELAKEAGFNVVVQEKLGVSNARNVGWKNAKGNLVFFIEADQILDKDCLKEIDKAFQDKKVMCARANVIPITKNWLQKGLYVQIQLASRRQQVETFPIIYRKKVLEQVGGYDENLDFAEDRELPKRVKKAGYVSKYLENAKLWVKPVDNLEKLYKQGRWYGRNILRYFKNSRDYATLGAVLTYASLLPLLILGIIYRPILILFAVPFALILYYTLRGLFITGSPYAFAMIPIAFVRGTGQLVGMIESPFKKGGGKVS